MLLFFTVLSSWASALSDSGSNMHCSILHSILRLGSPPRPAEGPLTTSHPRLDPCCTLSKGSLRFSSECYTITWYLFPSECSGPRSNCIFPLHTDRRSTDRFWKLPPPSWGWWVRSHRWFFLKDLSSFAQYHSPRGNSLELRPFSLNTSDNTRAHSLLSLLICHSTCLFIVSVETPPWGLAPQTTRSLWTPPTSGGAPRESTSRLQWACR